ncbi:MAG: hypothetical protein PHT41_05120 [Candidatus Omnitrophica bacterium]|nr:hypothetical protein [Candidatus Omnitrophota bacterium]MDD5238315.1 hypothetical protein [Candidatus Omnitrophota bacterium]
MKARKNTGKQEKGPQKKLFLEPRLTKRGSLKEVTFNTAAP